MKNSCRRIRSNSDCSADDVLLEEVSIPFFFLIDVFTGDEDVEGEIVAVEAGCSLFSPTNRLLGVAKVLLCNI